jgi:hypothetical protein
MDQSKLISVHDQANKIRALTDYAVANPELEAPTTQRQISKLLSELGHAVSESQLSKMKGSAKRLKLAVHRDLLGLFKIQWPCPYYFDPEPGSKRDLKAAWFRRYLFPNESPLRLAAIPPNHPAFRDRDLFVFEIQDQSEDHLYTGRVVAKPARKRLIGEDGEWAGQLLGHFCFAEFSFEFTSIEPVKFETYRPEEWDEDGRIDVTDRSTNMDQIWLCRARQIDLDRHAFLDGNFDVALLVVSEMEVGHKVNVKVTAPLPGLELSIPRRVATASKLNEQELETKLRKVAINKVVETYSKPGEASREEGNIVIGELSFRRRAEDSR